MSAASDSISFALQNIAGALDDDLKSSAGGERVAFVLIVQIDGIAQYVSNVSRPSGIELIKSLLARWEHGRADIPAHYNPDLRNPS